MGSSASVGKKPTFDSPQNNITPTDNEFSGGLCVVTPSKAIVDDFVHSFEADPECEKEKDTSISLFKRRKVISLSPTKQSKRSRVEESPSNSVNYC